MQRGQTYITYMMTMMIRTYTLYKGDSNWCKPYGANFIFRDNRSVAEN